MKLAVTGGAGFIGSHLAEYLLGNNYDVTVLDNLAGGRMENLRSIQDEIEFIKMDILDYEGLKKSLQDMDCVFHQAALTSVSQSFNQQERYFEVNVKGTENIFKLAREGGFKVVFASSAAVYGDTKIIPIREDFEKKPVNPYGRTKLEAEKLSAIYAEKGVSIVGLRYFNVYGPRQNDAYAGVVTRFLERVRQKKPLVIHGDGLQVRDFVFVGDVVRANLSAMKSSVNYTLVNIGSGIPFTINDLAQMVIRASGMEQNVQHDAAQEGEIRFSQSDIGLAKDILKWAPETGLEGWLEDILKN